jgi:acid phosphatase
MTLTRTLLCWRGPWRSASLLALSLALIGLTSCSKSDKPTAPRASGQFNHVFIVAEENTNYADVIGNAAMPYLNGLAQQYGLATQYYANTHPSIGNYLMMTCGDIVTNDDTYSSTVSHDNVVRELVAAGRTWKAYAEDIPSAGFVTLNYDDGNYASRHNPVVYYTDVHDHADQAGHVVPFSQFATDLSTYNFPNYSFIVPNLCNDGHDCAGAVVDTWLKNNIDPLVKDAHFQQDGLLIIVYDESNTDSMNGGGRIVWVAVSGKSKHGYQSTTLYQHESTLRLSLKALGVTAFPGAAGTAPDMGEFFNP